ncbi:AN1-like Zinc finger [Dictyocaulus viviparus]|uniref:AN1-like Zinc finger n=1 Tax=Dictyocaulus viviparus TaxID=29172 RepID=A0A0D8Y9B2_DICVI|nr:AN1-like Zinc finger [Dictyocaulus viviparus]
MKSTVEERHRDFYLHITSESFQRIDALCDRPHGDTVKKQQNSCTSKPRTPVDKKHSEWTAEKQMEHEITRNKMKCLLRKKRKKILNDTPPVSQGSIDSKSATGFTSPDDSSKEKSDSSVSSAPEFIGITGNSMKTFFEPPETLIEMERRKKELLLPPSNMEELKALRDKKEALLKTVCKMCHAKLKVTEQQMPCACGYVFCKLHRRPDSHYCNIDHRQTGRRKINKENPKLVFGGIRKARMTPHS